jgi:ribosomal protein S18 acetylase RimI-like enzyme
VFTIRPALSSDVPALTSFGARIFRETFEPHNRPEDLAAYLEATYSEDRQRSELEDPNRATLIAESPDGIAAFAQLRAEKTPSCVTGPAPIELLRFYVDSVWHGHGLAALLMDAVISAALARQCRTLWLGVWEHNRRAIAFYRKRGFQDVGSHEFLLGEDRQTDRIMVLSTRNDSRPRRRSRPGRP